MTICVSIYRDEKTSIGEDYTHSCEECGYGHKRYNEETEREEWFCDYSEEYVGVDVATDVECEVLSDGNNLIDEYKGCRWEELDNIDCSNYMHHRFFVELISAGVFDSAYFDSDARETLKSWSIGRSDDDGYDICITDTLTGKQLGTIVSAGFDRD